MTNALTTTAGLAVCIAGMSALFQVTTAVSAAESAPTFIGIVRTDGLLVPIAIYDGRDWWNRWPWAARSEELKALPVPPTLAAIPVEWLPPGLSLPSSWRLQRARGPMTTVRVSGPVRPSGWNLMDTIALRTNIRPGPIAPRGTAPEAAAEESIGVAVAGPGRLGRLVAASSSESDRILEQLRDRLRRLEDDELARWTRSVADNKGSVPSLVPEDRTAPGDTLGSLLKSDQPIDGRTYYYFDGGHRQRVVGDDCALFLSLRGLVVTDRSARVISERIAASAFGEYCGDAGESLDFLATVTIGGTQYWVMYVQAEDGYDYGVFDPERGDSVILKGGWGTAERAVWAPHHRTGNFAVQPVRSSIHGRNPRALPSRSLVEGIE